MDKKYYDLIEEFDENKLPDVNINESLGIMLIRLSLELKVQGL